MGLRPRGLEIPSSPSSSFPEGAQWLPKFFLGYTIDRLGYDKSPPYDED
ncbi:MAG: hypothetical protein QXO94_02490 [Candidatus Bathyarchaeia archaeon]